MYSEIDNNLSNKNEAWSNYNALSNNYIKYNNYSRHNSFNTPNYYNFPVFSPYYWNQFSGLPLAYINEMYSINSQQLRDYGPNPFVINIEDITKKNNNFRTALWTGSHMQLTLMSIEVDGEIGLEMHPDVDQFIRIEEGSGLVKMGDSEENLTFQENVTEDYIIIIPAGKWHNLINTGDEQLKLYSLYAPPNHPSGTVHETKEIADKAENH